MSANVVHMTQTSAPATAPDYTTRDTYAGHWTVVGVPDGMRVSVYTAVELAELAPEGTIWESFGHVTSPRGVLTEGFGRSRYIATAAGDLHVYDSTGRKVLVHPAARSLRVLTLPHSGDVRR